MAIKGEGEPVTDALCLYYTIPEISCCACINKCCGTYLPHSISFLFKKLSHSGNVVQMQQEA